MTPETRFDDVQLAARVTQAISNLYQLEYARISPDVKILQSSGNFGSIIDANLHGDMTGSLLADVLPEFVGSEDALHDILRGALPSYQVERVQRDHEDGSVQYLTFYVFPFDPNQPGNGLLLIVEDVTRFGQIERKLLQNRNELRLAQNALAQVNAELDARVEQRTAELEKAKKMIEKQLFHLQALRSNDLVILGATDLRLALKAIAREVRIQLHVDFSLHIVVRPANIDTGNFRIVWNGTAGA